MGNKLCKNFFSQTRDLDSTKALARFFPVAPLHDFFLWLSAVFGLLPYSSGKNRSNNTVRFIEYNFMPQGIKQRGQIIFQCSRGTFLAFFTYIYSLSNL